MYEALGLTASATADEIKRAYRKLAMKNHPDKGGDPEAFKAVQEAYDLLSDPEKKAAFDMYGPDGPPQHNGDLFSHVFRQTAARVRRQDCSHAVRVTMAEAFLGTTRQLKATVSKTCFECQKRCARCGGQGVMRISMGPMTLMQPCDACGGEGVSVGTGCSACVGGKVSHPSELSLKVAAGTRHGEQLRVAGLGEQPRKRGEVPGDLVIVIEVEAHPEFSRRGDVLTWTPKLSFEDSVRGAVVRCPHFAGDFDVDTAALGVIDPRKEYAFPGKGYNGLAMVAIFDVQYPPPAA